MPRRDSIVRRRPGTVVLVVAFVAAALAAACGTEVDLNRPADSTTLLPAAVRLSPPSVRIGVGEAQQLTAVVTDVTGAVMAGERVSWNTIDGSVASVTETGLVRGVAPGTTLVTAVDGRRIALDTVRVTAAP